MEVINGYRQLKGRRNIAVAVGNFDGIHLGHQQILSTLRERARALGVEPAVYTFRPHPRKVLTPHSYPALISSYREKFELLERAGIKLVVEEPFTLEFSKLSAEFFAEEILINSLGAKGIFVGEDFRFGRAAEGDTAFLERVASRRGVEFRAVPLLKFGDIPISSSVIRNYLKEGKLELANRLLGRYFSFEGVVAEGDGRGRKLGFPTANLVSEDGQIVPKKGVYAGITEVGGKIYTAVVNIGTRPTFYDGNSPTLVEAHLLNFDGDLYSKTLRVYFIEYLREERRFSSLAELKSQISKDCNRARELTAERSLSEEFLSRLSSI